MAGAFAGGIGTKMRLGRICLEQTGHHVVSNVISMEARMVAAGGDRMWAGCWSRKVVEGVFIKDELNKERSTVRTR